MTDGISICTIRFDVRESVMRVFCTEAVHGMDQSVFRLKTCSTRWASLLNNPRFLSGFSVGARVKMPEFGHLSHHTRKQMKSLVASYRFKVSRLEGLREGGA